jgi:hypothetical protein
MEILSNLEPLLKAFWYIAIPTSIVFIIQTALTLIGGDMADSMEIDSDSSTGHGGSDFQVFSFKNLVNFLLGFSWTGISFYSTIDNTFFLILLALNIGALFVYMFFIIIEQITKLAEDNSFKIEDTINKTGEVYLTIPEHKTGTGKVMISVNGSYRELEAMSEHARLESHTEIKVIKVDAENILIVEPLEEKLNLNPIK